MLDVDPRCRERSIMGVASIAIQAGKWDPLVGGIVRALAARDLARGVLMPGWQLLCDNMAFWRSVAVASADASISTVLSVAVASADASISTVLSVASFAIGIAEAVPLPAWGSLGKHMVASLSALPDRLYAAYIAALDWVLWFCVSWGSVWVGIRVLLVCFPQEERREPLAAPPRRKPRRERGQARDDSRGLYGMPRQGEPHERMRRAYPERCAGRTA